MLLQQHSAKQAQLFGLKKIQTQTNYPTFNLQQWQGDKQAVDGEQEGKPDQVSTGLGALQIGLVLKTTF